MQNSLNTGKIAAILREKQADFKALIGLDGFVDDIMHVVDKRKDAENFTKVATIAALGGRISLAAGLSTNIELVGVVEKLGGNGPIFANALAEQGMSTSYIGALGKESIHPIFADMSKKSKVFSLADPGLSFNLEFEDGKLIMGKHESLKDVNWDRLKEKVGLERLAQLMNPQNLDLLGLVNWTMLPYMSGIFRGMIDEVFPLISGGDCLAFFDLADPEKRTREDLADVLDLIREFASKYRAALGVNLKEGLQIAEVLGVEDIPEARYANLEEITTKTGKAMGERCSLAIHTVKDSAAYHGGRYYHAPGYFTPRPALTTGAGDNFNAGFCLGMLSGLEVDEALLVGNASSGYYVRHSGSATLSELVKFIEDTQPVVE